jgi:hypothetical protein
MTAMDGFSRGSLEAAVLHFLLDEVPESADCFLLGDFAVFPERPQLITPFGIGNVLVIPPEPVEPAAQLVNQIVVVITAAGGLTDVFKLVFCKKRHEGGYSKRVGNV